MESRQFRLRRLRSQIRLFLPVAFLVVSFCLITFGRFQNQFLQQFQFALQETVAPIVYVISSPVRWSKQAYRATVSFFNTYHENERLRADNDRLRVWRNLALRLATEQTQLQDLLNYTPPPGTKSLTASVLSDTGNRFAKSLIVSAGRNQGVTKGDIAMTSSGVLGRIVMVGRDASRLMLLTDYASRVPVFIGEEHIFGILSGDGSDTPKLISIPENKTVHLGDVVLSSGQVGVYPTGLAIGVVESINGGDIKVRLFTEGSLPAFVRLVNFGTNDVLLSDTCSPEE